MRYLMITVLAQIDDDSPLPTVPENWPEESYWVADCFDDPKNLGSVMKSARIAMDRRIIQDGMPGC